MDAETTHTPDWRIPVRIAGREINLLAPTQEQAMAVAMAQSASVGEQTAAKIGFEFLVALMPDDATREYVALQLVVGQIKMNDLLDDLARIATATPVDLKAPKAVVPPRAKKAAAKRATAKR